MPPSWTTEQILALAPDPSSAKNGKALATPRKWQSLGQEQQVVWGECQGSGSKPYQTQIDLSEPAFRCSCPSRKFPCKHGLGLFLLLVDQPQLIPTASPPGWVSEWLNSRAQRQAKQTEKQQAKAIADPAAKAKRTADRLKKVTAGVEDLQRWLEDLMRRGLASVQAESYTFWETPAARMVDAQAAGLARQLRQMAGVPHSGEGWPERLLAQLGGLHLLLEGFQRLDTLPAPLQAEIRTQIGWTQTQEDLLQAITNPETETPPEVLSDQWLVLGQSVEEEDRLRVQRTWLWGETSDRPALILNFAANQQPLDVSLVPGSRLQAELVYYPAAYPLRALVKQRQEQPTPLNQMPGYESLSAAIAAYSHALSCNPWLERFPMPLQQVIPFQAEDQTWGVRDSNDRWLPLNLRDRDPWQLLALSGGHAIGLFGEWQDQTLVPLSAWAEDRFSILT